MRVFNLVVLVVLLALIIGSDVLAGKDVKIIWVHKKEGKVEPVREKPFFGIMMSAVKDIGELGGKKGAPGIKITSVVKDSPADKAGLMENDVAFAMDGEPFVVKGKKDVVSYFRDQLFKYYVGDTIPLTVLRDGKSVEIKVKTGRRKGKSLKKNLTPPNNFI